MWNPTEVHLSEFWPPLSAHRLYWETHNNPHVYEYDPADDGPEVAIIAALWPAMWEMRNL